jgi:hypothetical protein
MHFITKMPRFVMTDKPFSLDIIDVASPCTADWEKMNGTDQVRRCGQCALNVYHLSNMTRAEAETLLLEHEGRICVRFYRRADGTVLTRDCPIGLQAIRRQLARLVAGVAAMIVFLVGGIAVGFGGSQSKLKLEDENLAPIELFGESGSVGPIGTLSKWLDPRRQRFGRYLFMGDVALPRKQIPATNAPPSASPSGSGSPPAGE